MQKCSTLDIDVSRLDPTLIQLLALQRIQQLLPSEPDVKPQIKEERLDVPPLTPNAKSQPLNICEVLKRHLWFETLMLFADSVDSK